MVECWWIPQNCNKHFIEIPKAEKKKFMPHTKSNQPSPKTPKNTFAPPSRYFYCSLGFLSSPTLSITLISSVFSSHSMSSSLRFPYMKSFKVTRFLMYWHFPSVFFFFICLFLIWQYLFLVFFFVSNLFPGSLFVIRLPMCFNGSYIYIHYNPGGAYVQRRNS